MTIVRVSHRSHTCALIDIRYLRDTSLSMRAKGLLTLCLALPRKTSFEQLVASSREGRDAVQAALRELRDAGYARIVRPRDKAGHISGKEWRIFESLDLNK